jgi:hypothetical protein
MLFHLWTEWCALLLLSCFILSGVERVWSIYHSGVVCTLPLGCFLSRGADWCSLLLAVSSTARPFAVLLVDWCGCAHNIQTRDIPLKILFLLLQYSQAPKSMKGLLSGLLMITIAMGNALIAALQLINGARSIVDFVYAGGIVVVLCLFLFMSRNYTYTSVEDTR